MKNPEVNNVAAIEPPQVSEICQLDDIVEKNLDITLQTAQQEYQNVVYGTWATHCSKLHTYLWLSIAVISAEAGFFLHIAKLNDATYIIPYQIILFSIFFQFIALFIAVFSMNGNGVVKRPIHGENYKYSILVSVDDSIGYRVRKEAIEALDSCITDQIIQIGVIANRMRMITKCTLLSLFFGALALAAYVYKYNILFCATGTLGG